MNKFLTTSLTVLILLTGAVGSASVAYAQVGDTRSFCDKRNNCNYTTQAAVDAANASADAAALAAAQKANTAYGPKLAEMYDWVMTQIMSLFAWLVGVAVLTLDYSVYYTVFKMGDYIRELTAVGVAWRILRDVGNIILIFGFLAIGITTILNVDWYGGAKKMLPMLLLSAVFLNFSLFFAQAVIDVGNLFAAQVYTQINGGTAPTAQSLTASTVLNAGNTGISAKIMSQLNLQALYNNANSPGLKVLETTGAPWYVGFLGILLFIVTAFVLFSLAFILIARFVVLIFLIILAPVGFAGLAIPQLAGRAKQWWSALFQQTITAPVLLLLLYVALIVITDDNFLRGFNVGNSSAVTGFVGTANVPGFGSYILSFLVAMGLLMAVAIAAKSLSAFGASAAMKGAGKLSFGVTALGMRTSVGWASQAAARRIRNSSVGATKTGRLLATTFDKGAKASFDVRGASVGGIGFKDLHIDAGKTAEGGYRAREEKAIKAHEEYAKSLTGQGATKEQKKALAEAEAARTRAETGKLSIKEHEEAAKNTEEHKVEVARHKAELARLEEEHKKDPYREANTERKQRIADAEQSLAAAKQSLAESEAKVASVLPAATQAAETVAAAEKAHAAVKADIEATTSAKGAQLSYGEHIRDMNPIGRWALFGPSGATAAKKIIKTATTQKSGKEKIFDMVKEAIEEENKAHAPKESKKEEGKPDTGGH